MSRVPADVEAARAAGRLPGRRGVWAAIREMGTFTRQDLRMAVPHVRQHVVHEYLAALIRSGRVAAGPMVPGWSRGDGKVRRYTLIRDTGVDAPRLRKDGSELPPTAQQLMWEAMRILGEFTAHSLAASASTGEVAVPVGTAASYIRHLRAAGYLGARACDGGGGIYRIAHDTGGLAPLIQRTKVVFDANLNRVMWHEDIEP